ncbi:MAG: hypothetical protein P8P74_16755 [Crocinitomicaceae bacterium]|nr:hypothetical protein [Crocinitomicaceae bacterium]
MKYLLNLSLLAVLLLLGACKKENPENPVSPNNYHLNILYGTEQNYSGNDGQWLNVYQATSSQATPVYIWAHGNGHTYMDAHEKYEPFVTSLLDNEISVISWESIKQMDDLNYVDILDDADLMFQWVKDNAETYNLDTTKIIIGGHSRGTIASWRLAQSGDPGIIGIYHGDAAGNLDDVNDVLGNLVSIQSPPIRMSYTQNFVTNDGQHDPNEGQIIIDLYSGSGFSTEDAKLLIDQGYPSMTDFGFYTDLLPFCLYVIN